MKDYQARAALAAICSLIATATPASAQTIYTDRAAFLAATTGQTISDFSNLGSGSGYGQSLTEGGFTLSTNTALIVAYDPNSSLDYQFNTGKVLALSGISATTGTFTLDAGTTAFGFDYGVLAGKNPAVTINGVSYSTAGAPALSFFGIVGAAALSPVNVGFLASRGIFDNVIVASAAIVPPTVTPAPVDSAVPEPATWAMMLFGFGAIGGTVRRRRTVLRFG